MSEVTVKVPKSCKVGSTFYVGLEERFFEVTVPKGEQLSYLVSIFHNIFSNFSLVFSFFLKSGVRPGQAINIIVPVEASYQTKLNKFLKPKTSSKASKSSVRTWAVTLFLMVSSLMLLYLIALCLEPWIQMHSFQRLLSVMKAEKMQNCIVDSYQGMLSKMEIENMQNFVIASFFTQMSLFFDNLFLFVAAFGFY